MLQSQYGAYIVFQPAASGTRLHVAVALTLTGTTLHVRGERGLANKAHDAAAHFIHIELISPPHGILRARLGCVIGQALPRSYTCMI